MESFLGHLLAGGIFCLLAGQPLTVLGCTGPVLIFEKILVNFCHAYGIYYLTMRLWIGLWSTFFCLLIVAFDLSAIVRFAQYSDRFSFNYYLYLDILPDLLKRHLQLLLGSFLSWNHLKSFLVSH